MRKNKFLACVVFLLVGFVFVFSGTGVAAYHLSQSSLSVGSSLVGATTYHKFAFTYVSNTAVGSVTMQYCTNPLPQVACVAPAGLNVSGVTLSNQTGETGFSILSATTNKITLTRAPTTTGNTASSYRFSNAVNPSGSPSSFFVRLATYASIDGTGSVTDFGAVVNSTARGVAISSEVPPILEFCVGQTIPGTCSTASGNLVDVGTLVSSTVASGTSQMIAGTNGQSGIVITVNGTTMTSGNNTIAALTSPTPSAPGNSQFGINLRANSDPLIGLDPSGPGTANPSSGYDVPNKFKFVNGNIVAYSPAETDSRKFTVSYITNVSPSQAPGVYTTTVTYICTATF